MIFRLETIYDFGIYMLDRDKSTTFAPLLPGTTRKDMWKGMIAFDRPTWIRALNKKTTFFITGQWFLHHIMHNEDTLATALDLPTAGARSRPFCGSDKFTPCNDPTATATSGTTSGAGSRSSPSPSSPSTKVARWYRSSA
jgi:hypothetical protein